ncbi:carbon-nitrogen hydrolase family protein [Deinococcus irradiatisoli]|uniref:Carbon-nitrogen hydrolase family protein n=1 Tax=Deinococcus irradiatisoli TaxID=2202254 RepID=A0A2Z3JGE9_9DEIO|nr:nitrilase-related carbon-nitrogen hydrolase [Deinococcus irradiatisoli]AWN21999.1 carbon-nitrogen hydrolase family protein [Deinococcus irradiatisoli]
MTPRRVRAVAVQPHWHAEDFLSAAAFRRWMRAQLEAARPHLSATQPNLVVLTELNGLPLVLRGGYLAAATGRFEWAAALLLLQHLPSALPILLRERVSPIRALQLARANENAALYLRVCQQLAREYGVYLVCGSTPMPHYRLHGWTLRREGSALYNQTVILGPDGTLIGTADKVHLTPDEEQGGVDLSPGDLAELRVFPTPAGDLGVAISLDAFRADVTGKLAAQGCTVLLQPDANGSPWTGLEGIYPPGTLPRDQPLAWLESSWQVTAAGQIRYAVNPMVVGNLLDMTFDGQSAITGPQEEGLPPVSYVMTPPRRGFLALLPWVERGSPAHLREVGRQLAARSGHPRENAYLSGVLQADLTLPPQTLPPPPPTPHEQALGALLAGQATLPPSAGRWLWWLLGLGAAWWSLRRR